MACTHLQAKDGDQLTLEAGTANVIWTLSSAYFETDFAGASVEGTSWDQWLKKKGDDYVRDWPNDQQKVNLYFMKRFNKKTRKKGGLMLQNTNPNDAYRFVVHFTDIDMGSIGGGVVASVFLGAFAKKSGGVNFKSGYIDVVDQATNTVVCRLGLKDVRGDSGLNMSAQLILAMEDLHDEIIGFAERFSDKQVPNMAASGAPVAVVAPSIAQNAAVQPQTYVAQPQPVAATSQMVKVKLKTGATITGTLKHFDPLEAITLVIAGQETKIPMSKVENVEMPEGAQQQAAVVQPQPVVTAVAAGDNNRLGNQKLLVTETKNYPEQIQVTIGNEPVRMLLVKGGRMNMGFDGDHSLRMESEPVHEVEVTSYYISEKPLSRALVLKYGKADADENAAALVGKYSEVEKVINGIARETGKPYRLPTEAEWEYAASCELQNQIFADVRNKKKIAYDWCSDYYDEYKTGGQVIDPTGPLKGKDRVVRAFNNKYGKYDRRNELSIGRYTLGCIRLVIKAKDMQ